MLAMGVHLSMTSKHVLVVTFFYATISFFFLSFDGSLLVAQRKVPKTDG